MVSFVFLFSYLICQSVNVKMFAVLWFRNCSICSSNASTGYNDSCIVYELLVNDCIKKYCFKLESFAMRIILKVAFAFIVFLFYICIFNLLSK